jgi:hypothetical protein
LFLQLVRGATDLALPELATTAFPESFGRGFADIHSVVNRVSRVDDAVFENLPPCCIKTPILNRKKAYLLALTLVFPEERPQAFEVQVGKSK